MTHILSKLHQKQGAGPPIKVINKRRQNLVHSGLSTMLGRRKTDPAHLDIDHETKEKKLLALTKNFAEESFFVLS